MGFNEDLLLKQTVKDALVNHPKLFAEDEWIVFKKSYDEKTTSLLIIPIYILIVFAGMFLYVILIVLWKRIKKRYDFNFFVCFLIMFVFFIIHIRVYLKPRLSACVSCISTVSILYGGIST